MTAGQVIQHFRSELPRYLCVYVQLGLGLACVIVPPSPVSTLAYIRSTLGITPLAVGVILVITGIVIAFTQDRRLHWAAVTVGWGMYALATFAAGLSGMLAPQASIPYTGLWGLMLLVYPREDEH